MSYGPTRMETLEVYEAENAESAPIFVFVHGGAWKSLDASVFSLAIQHARAGLRRAWRW